jgi:hypothetical protein
VALHPANIAGVGLDQALAEAEVLFIRDGVGDQGADPVAVVGMVEVDRAADDRLIGRGIDTVDLVDFRRPVTGLRSDFGPPVADLGQLFGQVQIIARARQVALGLQELVLEFAAPRAGKTAK